MTKKLYKRLMTPQEIEKFFSVLSRQDPAPKTELYFTTPYTLLVAVVLSAQATDRGVNKATKSLFEQVQTPAQMLELGIENLALAIKTIGLYKTKARNIMAAAQILVERFDGEIPETLDALMSLPGVGRKTANVILNTLFHQPTIAVDTHVFRVSNRTGLAPGKTVREVEDFLGKRIPAPWLLNAHHWLILHGRYICKARTPECYRCPVSEVCQYLDKSSPIKKV